MSPTPADATDSPVVSTPARRKRKVSVDDENATPSKKSKSTRTSRRSRKTAKDDEELPKQSTPSAPDNTPPKDRKKKTTATRRTRVSSDEEPSPALRRSPRLGRRKAAPDSSKEETPKKVAKTKKAASPASAARKSTSRGSTPKKTTKASAKKKPTAKTLASRRTKTRKRTLLSQIVDLMENLSDDVAGGTTQRDEDIADEPESAEYWKEKYLSLLEDQESEAQKKLDSYMEEVKQINLNRGLSSASQEAASSQTKELHEDLNTHIGELQEGLSTSLGEVVSGQKKLTKRLGELAAGQDNLTTQVGELVSGQERLAPTLEELYSGSIQTSSLVKENEALQKQVTSLNAQLEDKPGPSISNSAYSALQEKLAALTAQHESTSGHSSALEDELDKVKRDLKLARTLLGAYARTTNIQLQVIPLDEAELLEGYSEFLLSSASPISGKRYVCALSVPDDPEAAIECSPVPVKTTAIIPEFLNHSLTFDPSQIPQFVRMISTVIINNEQEAAKVEKISKQ